MKTTIVALSLVASTGLFAQSQAFYGPWKGFSDPEIMSSGFTHVLSELPLEGSIQNDSRG